MRNARLLMIVFVVKQNHYMATRPERCKNLVWRNLKFSEFCNILYIIVI